MLCIGVIVFAYCLSVVVGTGFSGTPARADLRMLKPLNGLWAAGRWKDVRIAGDARLLMNDFERHGQLTLACRTVMQVLREVAKSDAAGLRQ